MDFSKYTTKASKAVLAEFNTSLQVGLNEDQVSVNKKKYGLNEISSNKVVWRKILFRQFKSSFIYLLLVAAGVALILGEQINAAAILVFILINTTLGFYQEYHSEKTVQLLKKYIVAKVKVKRDGKDQIINSTDLVCGDMVIVETGDVIPADLRFLSAHNLFVDESVLTGESIAVSKQDEPLNKSTEEIYQAANIGFSGTTVVSGDGEGVVIAVGRQAAMGKIAHLATETIRESSFEKEIRKLSNFILKMVSITLVLVVLANVLFKDTPNFAELLIFSIALAVSVIPEALPVVMIFSLSQGALHLAKNKVVVKRLSAIEDLGSIKILCTDKTGTITENKLTVSDFYPSNLKEEILIDACLGIAPSNKVIKGSANSFDVALLSELTEKHQEKIKPFVFLSEIPFDPGRRRNSVLVKNGNSCNLIVRGAAESVIKYCKNLSPLEIKKIDKWTKGMGHEGKRILAIAKRKCPKNTEYKISEEERDLEFVGLVSFVDPIKPSTRAAVEKARELGVKIKIITGDSREVAGAIAYQAGIVKSSDDVLIGEDLAKMGHEEQHEAVDKYDVFARISPEQKYRIIELLKEKEEVGFLGEGINDAPALKIANVAIVVDSASDISRDAADILLLKKSLEVIVDGIKEGRRVFANTFKYIKTTLASNFGNFYAVAVVSLLIDYLPMLPIQILLLNLLSDFPMIAVATDTVDNQELKSPQGYNLKEIALMATFLGLVSTVFDFIFFALFSRGGSQVLQTNWFIGSILTELALIFSLRTRFVFFKTKHPSAILSWLAAGAACLTIAIPFTAIGQKYLNFVAPTNYQLIMIASVVATYFVVTESVKLFYYRFTNHRNLAEIKN